MASTDELHLAEYRHISDAIMDIDRRLLQVFAGTVTAAGALLAFAGTREASPSLGTSLLILSPGFLVTAALNLQLSFRREIAKLGMYRKVFFEDGSTEGATWENALAALRKGDIREANDPMPIVYWLFVALSCTALLARLIAAGGLYWHLALVAVPVGLLRYVNGLWNRVYPDDRDRFEAAWRDARGRLAAPGTR